MAAPDLDRKSFWSSLPGILTGSAALITALGGLLALFLNRAPSSSAPDVGTPTTVTATPPNDVSCFTSYVTDVPPSHQKTVKVGAADFRLNEPEEKLERGFAVRMMDSGRSLGLLRFTVDPADGSFEVQKVLNSSCAPVTDVSNPDRGGGLVLQNWDQVKMRIDSATYVMRLGYDAGIVQVGHFTRLPQ